MSVNKEYNKVKRERGSNIVFPIILRLLGRISSGEKGKGGRKFRERKKKDMDMGRNIKF